MIDTTSPAGSWAIALEHSVHIQVIESGAPLSLGAEGGSPNALRQTSDHAPSHEAECLEARAAVSLSFHNQPTATEGQPDHV